MPVVYTLILFPEALKRTAEEAPLEEDLKAVIQTPILHRFGGTTVCLDGEGEGKCTVTFAGYLPDSELEELKKFGTIVDVYEIPKKRGIHRLGRVAPWKINIEKVEE